MLPLTLIDTAEIPGGGELRLMRRGNDFSILFGRNELMSSRVRGSEEALATLTCERLHASRPEILIGGLGLGFTLGAALAALPSGASIKVAELVPQILAWAKGPLAHIFGDNLADPRVSVEIGDVHDAIAQGRFDAILLDVDNGPDGMVHEGNHRLYGHQGLGAAFNALKPGGILGVWSAYPDPAFANRMRKARFAVDEIKTRSTGGRKGAHHIIWIGTKRG